MSDAHPAANADGSASGGAGETAAACVERVWALESFGRSDDALAEVQRGLAQFPEDPDLIGSLAWIEFFYGNKTRAEQAAQHALATRPDDWRGLTILLETELLRGNAAEAVILGQRYVAQYSDWPEAKLSLAHARCQPTSKGSGGDSAQESGKGSKAGKAGKARESRADREARRRDVQELVTDAVALDPERVESLRRGSILLAVAGDDEGSAKLLNRALELDPTNEQLIMLVAGSTGTTEVDGLRLLSGVLTSNPQQRQAARVLSSTVWHRTRRLATISLIVLAGMLLFGHLVFEAGLTTTSRQRAQLGGVFVAAGVAWFLLFVKINRVLPKGYLRRLFAPVGWVWAGIALSAIAMLACVLIALVLGIRGLPTQMERSGEYIGGITAMIGFVAWLTLLAELVIVFASFASERRNSLYPADEEGLAAVRIRHREEMIVLAVRVGLALAFVFVPLYAAAIATRPEAAGAFPAVATAIAVPAMVTALLSWADVLRVRQGQSRGQAAPRSAAPARAVWIFALAFAVAASVAGWLLADFHAGQNDPPPTPFEIEMAGRGEKLQELLKRQEAARERLRNISPPGEMHCSDEGCIFVPRAE